jgi:glycosyltransferase involved in cell wall biosynthesis
MKRLLLLAYFYPPLGGPGVQRPLKLVKYLCKFGWQTDVITVKDIVFHSFDHTLLAENKAEKVFSVSSLDPMSLMFKSNSYLPMSQKDIYFKTPERIKKIIRNSFPIDDKIGWLPMVMKSINAIMNENQYDAVMATMGPYTSGVIAFKISRKFNLPLILDYRDHWILNPYQKYSFGWLRKQAERWEKKLLSHARIISVIGRRMKEDLIENFGSAIEEKTLVVYNGWDDDDFAEITETKNKKIIIRYVGNFYGHRRIDFFLSALDKIDPHLRSEIEIELIGNYYRETLAAIENSNHKDLIRITQQVSHKKAVELMMNSDLLLLFIATPNGEGVITGKIFEYLRCRKPILAMIPTGGETAQILRDNGHQYICEMENVDNIALALNKILYEIKMNRIPAYNFDNRLSRENQTAGFISFLERRL